ncbi:hypothetical protein [Nitrosomonas aestuarii]|uniref:hypothetical protein n=1 Tax=Nitrosomonas aestuarii TaxID=52441 RepID=UPI0011142D6B|nr:hypothetical protein [Nitrosomonas aestuarii]
MPARHDGRGRNGMCCIAAAHREKVLEIGCSNGRITEYLQQTSWYRIHGALLGDNYDTILSGYPL